MKKRILIICVTLFSMVNLFAYNPSLGSEKLFKISNPELLSGAASASGGPILTIVPGSIAYNPALAVFEQRTNLNLSATTLFGGSDKNFGMGFQLGTIIPTRFYVYSANLNGVFSNFASMDLGDSFDLHLGIAKEIVEKKLSVGLNLYNGYYFNSKEFDYTVGADLGMLYVFDDMGFLKSPRLGISLLNLGKPASNSPSSSALKKDKLSHSDSGFITPRVSFAGTLFDVKSFTGGFSADLTCPSFQNAILDLALGFSYNDFVNLFVSWDFNVLETVKYQAKGLVYPNICLSFKFAFNSSKILKNNENWSQSEISPSLAWQNLYDGIQALSFGAKFNLGMEDTSAPDIFLWDEE